MENSVDDKTQLFEKDDIVYKVTKIFKSNEYFIETVKITLSEFTGGTFGHWFYRDNRGHSIFNRNVGKSYFKTKEEAEQEIQRKQNITKKRKLLKEYERKLNEELNLKNNYIIK